MPTPYLKKLFRYFSGQASPHLTPPLQFNISFYGETYIVNISPLYLHWKR